MVWAVPFLDFCLAYLPSPCSDHKHKEKPEIALGKGFWALRTAILLFATENIFISDETEYCTIDKNAQLILSSVTEFAQYPLSLSKSVIVILPSIQYAMEYYCGKI